MNILLSKIRRIYCLKSIKFGIGVKMAIICLILLFVTFTSYSQVFGVASEYNLFSRNGVKLTSSDVEGRIAAGGNSLLQTSYSVGIRMSENASRYDLVVDGTLTSGGIVMESGNIIHSGAFTNASGSIFYNFTGGQRVQGASPINFSSVQTSLIALSDGWAILTATGSSAYTSSTQTLTLTGTNTSVNIFNFPSGFNMGAVYNLRINVPSGSTVLINYGGTTVNFNSTAQMTFNTFNWNGSSYVQIPGAGGTVTSRQLAQKIIWNFYDATTLNVENMGLKGTVLAPIANLRGQNGHIDGNVIVSSISADGTNPSNLQINWFPFNGDVPNQTCSLSSELIRWNFDSATDGQIDNTSGIASSSSSSCISGLLKRTDGGSNSVYSNTVGGVSSDYGPVCSSSKSICTGTWDSATPFDRYISLKVTYPVGTKGNLTGLSFCEITMARTKSGGSFVTNNKPEKYQVRLVKRVNGGAWVLVWTGGILPTTQTDWTGTSSNPIPPTTWGSYNSNNDGFVVQTTDGSATVEFEFQISAFQNTSSSSSQEIWDLDEVSILGCCCALSAPTAADASRCGTGSVTLSASNCSGTYNWYNVASGGSSLSTAATYTTPSISATTSYYVSCTVGTCTSSRDVVVATINAIPATPTATDGSRCGAGTVNVSASNCSGTYNWYNVASGGSSLSTAATYTTPSISATTSYYVSCTVGTCTSGRDVAVATINTIPPTPVVNSPVICQGESVNLSVTPTSGSTIIWQYGGITTSTLPTPNTNLPSINLYYVRQQSSAGCNSPLVLQTLTINAKPIAEVSKIDAQCLGYVSVNNATLILNKFTSTETFAYGSPIAANPTFLAIPANGIIVSILPNTTSNYTVRIKNTSGCMIDRPITITAITCPCFSGSCESAVVTKIK